MKSEPLVISQMADLTADASPLFQKAYSFVISPSGRLKSSEKEPGSGTGEGGTGTGGGGSGEGGGGVGGGGGGAGGGGLSEARSLTVKLSTRKLLLSLRMPTAPGLVMGAHFPTLLSVP